MKIHKIMDKICTNVLFISFTSFRFFCTNCSMNYCVSCLTRHDKNPIFKDHRVIDKTSDSSNEAFCKVHKGEQVLKQCFWKPSIKFPCQN